MKHWNNVCLYWNAFFRGCNKNNLAAPPLPPPEKKVSNQTTQSLFQQYHCTYIHHSASISQELILATFVVYHTHRYIITFQLIELHHTHSSTTSPNTSTVFTVFPIKHNTAHTTWRKGHKMEIMYHLGVSPDTIFVHFTHVGAWGKVTDWWKITTNNSEDIFLLSVLKNALVTKPAG